MSLTFEELHMSKYYFTYEKISPKYNNLNDSFDGNIFSDDISKDCCLIFYMNIYKTFYVCLSNICLMGS